MLKPHSHPNLLLPQSPQLPESFNLLVWNLQKTPVEQLTTAHLHSYLPVLTHTPIHLYAFQEAKLSNPAIAYFDLPYFMSSNIQSQRHHYGVLTASAYQMADAERLLTQKRELGLLTHKSALLTTHPLNNGQTLYLLNLHAMIFVPYFFIKKELQRITHLLKQIPESAPLIVSGDFNTWSQKRNQLLHDTLTSLNLQAVPFENAQYIKSIHHHLLDHIYYRYLKLTHAQAYAVPQCSDHNPLIAQFSTLKEINPK